MRNWLRPLGAFCLVLLWSGWLLAAGFCVKCGEKLENGVKFCPKCGHEVGKPLDVKEQPKPEKPKPAPVYETIEEADAYFELAQQERTSVGALLLPHVKKRRYEKALDLYTRILEKWPNSDKCEESAYYAGEIYASTAYKDYDRALRYFRMVLAINPETTMDARLRLAEITENGIRDFAGAAALYEDCIENARVQDEKEQAAKQLGRLKEKMAEAEQRLDEAAGE